MGMLDTFALRLVDGYRSTVSPRKGWRCAAGVAGGSTCSTAIRATLASQGVARSVVPAARQFASCARAARTLGAAPRMVGGTATEGVCCCGPIPIPFRF